MNGAAGGRVRRVSVEEPRQRGSFGVVALAAGAIQAEDRWDGANDGSGTWKMVERSEYRVEELDFGFAGGWIQDQAGRYTRQKLPTALKSSGKSKTR
jgi:hypothetical protein